MFGTVVDYFYYYYSDLKNVTLFEYSCKYDFEDASYFFFS